MLDFRTVPWEAIAKTFPRVNLKRHTMHLHSHTEPVQSMNWQGIDVKLAELLKCVLDSLLFLNRRMQH